MGSIDLNREWLAAEFVNQEMALRHRGLEPEFDFYDAIATGNLDAVKENCKKKMFVDMNGVGKLSRDPLRNMKYHFVVTAAMIVRYCVHNGMSQEKAYSLSDFYILKADETTGIEELNRIHDEMCIDICSQMKEIRKQQILSKPIVLCMDYIYSHIHYRITIEELAQHLNISTSYLSRLFKKEMGIHVSEYINELKIEQAKNMLQYSDLKIIDIANYRSYSSQSHFIQVFQKITGLTPHKFRQQNFRNSWNKMPVTGEGAVRE